MTLGQNLVVKSFNPSQFPEVDLLKQKTAELIDFCDEHLMHRDARWASEAITKFEEACMWAVKAATARKDE